MKQLDKITMPADVEDALEGLSNQNEGHLKRAMSLVWLIVQINYMSRLNPLPGIRKRFPEFTWEFIRTVPTPAEIETEFAPSNLSDEVLEAVLCNHLVWDVGDGLLFAKWKNGTMPKYSFNLSQVFIFLCPGLDGYTHFYECLEEDTDDCQSELHAFIMRFIG